MHIRTLLATGLLALAGATSAQAATIEPLTPGVWSPFDVAEDLSGHKDWIDLAYNVDAGLLSFSFVVPTSQIGTLTIVDAGFAGDRFRITAGGSVLGDTTPAVNTALPDPGFQQFDFDAALADTRFSRGIWGFSAGSYTVTGTLIESAVGPASALNPGGILNSSTGALILTLAPVPETSTLAMLLAGLGLVGAAARRRAA